MHIERPIGAGRKHKAVYTGDAATIIALIELCSWAIGRRQGINQFHHISCQNLQFASDDISTHNKYDDHTQMMSNVHECRVRCGG